MESDSKSDEITQESVSISNQRNNLRNNQSINAKTKLAHGRSSAGRKNKNSTISDENKEKSSPDSSELTLSPITDNTPSPPHKRLLPHRPLPIITKTTFYSLYLKSKDWKRILSNSHTTICFNELKSIKEEIYSSLTGFTSNLRD